MNESNYTIIRCWTIDKNKVMNTLCNALEYKLIKNHIDVVYYNGDSQEEKEETQNIIKESINLLQKNSIKADSKPEYIYDWLFIRNDFCS